MKNKTSLIKDINKLENQIEEGLIISHEYQNPNIFLPYNPIFQLIKKIYLKFLSMYTKYQIVFNQNIFYSLNKIYQYSLYMKNEIEEQKKEIEKLKKEIKKLKKFFKNNKSNFFS